ncbi:MAG: transglutaminase-like domain-containing protein, partial [Candidatus Diapherotrites archaeon]|nr:transglutaminase-like domain-containing protein [Candidatus Diapherotrites archaeon]
MRPPVFLILLVLLAGSAAATLQLNPNTIGEMKATAQLHATVDINGNTTAQDRLEIRMLTFSDDEHQHTTDRSDKLVIKDKTLEPTYETKNNSRYALYTVSNLAQYGQEFRIDIYSNATIETTTSFLLNTDYNLATPITENTEFLKPSAYIETDDPALIAKTNIQFQSDSQLETIRQITDWMHDNITYDFENYYNGVWSAKQTYENRAGVCDEFANLSAAFLRIKGIPTRYVAGISFDGTRFGNHGWLESFLPGTGWIPIDTTYGEAGYLDAMHIAVGKANDTNNLQNLAITTTSSHALTVSAILQDPYIDTNNLTYQTIQKLTQIRIQTPGKIGSRQPFQIKTVLTNQTNHPLIVPLELSLHPDFEYTHKTKQILLAANGQTAIDWNAVSPANAQLGYLTTYELRLSAPDQTVDANLVIDP